MDQFTLADRSLQLIRKDLVLEGNIQLEGSNDPFVRLLEYLVKQINYKLNHDFNGLLNALYRIDIPENQVKMIIETFDSDQIALELARAILERQRQKILTREKYHAS